MQDVFTDEEDPEDSISVKEKSEHHIESRNTP